MTFVNRLLHQLRTDWRHLRLPCLTFYAWLIVILAQAIMRDAGPLAYGFERMSQGLTLGAIACLAFASVWGDAPANTNTGSLSRPMGQGTVWLAKALFALLAIALPLWVSEAMTWRGFDLGLRQWLALSAGSFLGAGLVIVLASTLAGVSASLRQAAIAGSIGLVVGGVWWFSGVNVFTRVLEALYLRPGSPDERYGTMQNCGHLAGCVMILGAGLGAWWLATMRRRWPALALMAAALLLEPVVQNLWRSPDWLAVPELTFPKEQLVVKTGATDPADKAPGYALWSTLRLAGLKPDEVPSILAFAPVDKHEAWPPLGSYTDLPRSSGEPQSWISLDHLRSVSRRFDATDLWQRGWSGRFNTDKPRPPLVDALKPLKLNRKAVPSPSPGRLRVAVHEMRKFAEVPLSALIDRPQTFLVRPGLRLELNPLKWTFAMFILQGSLHEVGSTFLPLSTHIPLREQYRENFHHLGPDILLVLRDSGTREDFSLQAGADHEQTISFTFQEHRFAILRNTFSQPLSHKVLLHETRDDWIARTTVSFWIPEERGTVDIELSPAQMRQVLAK